MDSYLNAPCLLPSPARQRFARASRTFAVIAVAQWPRVAAAAKPATGIVPGRLLRDTGTLRPAISRVRRRTRNLWRPRPTSAIITTQHLAPKATDMPRPRVDRGSLQLGRGSTRVRITAGATRDAAYSVDYSSWPWSDAQTPPPEFPALSYRRDERGRSVSSSPTIDRAARSAARCRGHEAGLR